MTDVPGNGSLFMQSLVKRLLQLLEKDPKSIVQRVIDESDVHGSTYNMYICSIKGCLQLFKHSRSTGWIGGGGRCDNCDKAVCYRFHVDAIPKCDRCDFQFCESCQTVSKCKLCVESGHSTRWTFYCDKCLDHNQHWLKIEKNEMH